MEAGFSDNGSGKTDDLTLATGELAIEGTVRDGVVGHLLYARDDEASEFSLDEAYIALEKGALFYMPASRWCLLGVWRQR